MTVDLLCKQSSLVAPNKSLKYQIYSLKDSAGKPSGVGITARSINHQAAIVKGKESELYMGSFLNCIVKIGLFITTPKCSKFHGFFVSIFYYDFY